MLLKVGGPRWWPMNRMNTAAWWLDNSTIQAYKAVILPTSLMIGLSHSHLYILRDTCFYTYEFCFHNFTLFIYYIHLLTLHMSTCAWRSNRRRGWYSLVGFHPSTSHQLYSVRASVYAWVCNCFVRYFYSDHLGNTVIFLPVITAGITGHSKFCNVTQTILSPSVPPETVSIRENKSHKCCRIGCMGANTWP